MFFDKHVLKEMPGHSLYSVDVAYEGQKLKYLKIPSNTKLFKTVHELPDIRFDYAIMMDSLEMIDENDALQIVDLVSDKINKGGYVFFTVTAFQFLYSDHDKHVGALRRYSLLDFKRFISQVNGLNIISTHYFYTSLFFIRLSQKLFHLKIDPNQVITTGWPHARKTFPTKLTTLFLNMDYWFCQTLAKAGIHVPGLSLMVICRKN